jgi:hypothetical protein
LRHGNVSLLRTQTFDEASELVDTLVALRHPRVVAHQSGRALPIAGYCE